MSRNYLSADMKKTSTLPIKHRKATLTELLRYLLCLIAILTSTGVRSQAFVEAKLQPEGNMGLDDHFGDCVAFSGEFAFVAAPWQDINGTSSGAVYVFKRCSGNNDWCQSQVLTASDGRSQDFFGVSLVASDDYLVVGSSFDEIDGYRTGSAYLYRRVNDQWSEVAKLQPADLSVASQFGTSVAMQGEHIFVGSPADYNVAGLSVGSSYVFKQEEQGNDSSWVEVDRLFSSDMAEGDRFGRFVAIHNNQAFISAIEDDDLGAGSGSVYIFNKDIYSDNWEELGKLTATDGHSNHLFGISIVLEEYRAFIGASTGLGSVLQGDVYVFEFDDDIGWWSEKHKVNANDGDGRNFFGLSIDANEDTLVVGAFEALSQNIKTGGAYVFTFDGNAWNQLIKLTPSDGMNLDWFGYSVAINSGDVLVGAPYANDPADDSGAGYIYSDNLSNFIDIGDPALEQNDLRTNYPNPFNPATNIEYTIAKPGMVSLVVYNVRGQKVKTLVDGRLGPGSYRVTWDGHDNTGVKVASGIYFYKLSSAEFKKTQKMILLD